MIYDMICDTLWCTLLLKSGRLALWCYRHGENILSLSATCQRNESTAKSKQLIIRQFSQCRTWVSGFVSAHHCNGRWDFQTQLDNWRRRSRTGVRRGWDTDIYEPGALGTETFMYQLPGAYELHFPSIQSGQMDTWHYAAGWALQIFIFKQWQP